jgi:non-heme chloroperoxidase
MSYIRVKDGTEIFFKDWGTGRVIAHDRRGHGRSTQTSKGHDMDTYAADVAEVVKHLDLKDSIHIGHSTGGGEVTRHVAAHGKGRVKKAVLISAMVVGSFLFSARVGRQQL